MIDKPTDARKYIPKPSVEEKNDIDWKDNETEASASGEVHDSSAATAVTPTRTRRNGDATVSDNNIAHSSEESNTSEENNPDAVDWEGNREQRLSVSDEDDGIDLSRYSGRDRVYMEAVKNGNTETSQRMVDEAAKQAGFTIKAYHGTRSGEFYVFDRSRSGSNYGGYNVSGGGFDFTTNERFANLWGRKANGEGEVRVMPVFLKAEKTFYAYRAVPSELAEALPDNLQIMDRETGEVFDGDEAIQKAMHRGADFQDALEENGIDFVSVLQAHGFDSYAMHEDDENIAVYNEDQIKSSEPIVRDDDGKVIPLSERFRTDRSGEEAWKNRDIRFSPSEDEGDSWGVDWIGKETGETDSSTPLRSTQNDNGVRRRRASEENPSTASRSSSPACRGGSAETGSGRKEIPTLTVCRKRRYLFTPPRSP